MSLSWNEIKDRALQFSKEWKDETREDAEAKSFWDDFFHVFGITRRRVASFEEPVKNLKDKYGFIDLFWKGTLLVEHKSKGKDLDKAYSQAVEYFSGLKEHELPKYIIVSDFERLRLYNLEDDSIIEFHLKDFYKNVKNFGFICGYQKTSFKEEDPVNLKAADYLGKIHDKLHASGYCGHQLEVFLVRLLFCFFADDTGIFEKDIFKEYIENRTSEDGSDLGPALTQLYQVLNKPVQSRQKALDEDLNQFPYVNGKLFEEILPIPAFTTELRDAILECSSLDWSKISPAIFGSMFQAVMNPDERRNLGAHYTSEKNILKLIKPLFLDELRQEFNKSKKNKKLLQQLHKKLSTLTFLDPACGCGNFLVITYRELRFLELDILKALHLNQQTTEIANIIWIDIDQFYGIEIEEWPARIAEVAMWLIDHQMNTIISEEFGKYFIRLPLKTAANIVHGNALRINWSEIIPNDKLSYILGNPPYVGRKFRTREQTEDMDYVFNNKNISNYKLLDYVACWYQKATEFIHNTKVFVGYVSTNSITQGEQATIFASIIKEGKIYFNFAHRTFKWSNEARRSAAVYVVIIGFAKTNINKKNIFDYSELSGEPVKISAKLINNYLVDYPTIEITNRTDPLCNVPEILFGNSALDGGYLRLTKDEAKELAKKYPKSKKYLKKLWSSEELLHNIERYCIWLHNENAIEALKIKGIKERVEMVKRYRLNSARAATQRLAETPYLFGEIRNKYVRHILIPSPSSENRIYIPMGYFSGKNIPLASALFIPGATYYHFGVLSSSMHMAWTKQICGRLKSDIRYSNKLVYNNYPWPKPGNKQHAKKIEELSKAILKIRDEYPNTLAELYNPIAMPKNLLNAHQKLDKAVDKCYRSQPFPNEKSRIEFLFDLYQKQSEPLIAG